MQVACYWLVLVAAVFLGNCADRAGCVTISVTPADDVAVPITSEMNITYTCEVDAGRIVLWEFEGAQLVGTDTISDLEATGVFVVNDTGTRSSLLVTAMARRAYLDQNVSSVSVQCDAFSSGRPPMVDEGETYFVITFGPPDLPTNLQITPNPIDLSEITFSWDQPSNIPQGVVTNYTVRITGARNNITMTTTELSYTFRDTTVMALCEEHSFSVSGSHVAGEGPPAVTMATIPISPIVTDINDQFRVSSLTLTENGRGRLEVTFPPATTCGNPFPIQRYMVEVIGFPSLTQTIEVSEEQPSAPVTVAYTIGPVLQQGEVYFMRVNACISVTCRPSQLFTVFTTDVQEASITFFENNVLLTCSFADQGPAVGCVITLTLVDGSETFYLRKPESGTMATQCNITTSQNNAYNSTVAADWNASGAVGMTTVSLVRFVNETEGEFTDSTGCSIPGPPRLAPGAIAGIVLGILAAVIIVIGVVIVLAVVGYKLRVGRWFKVKKREGDEFTVDFERDLLMEEKPKRKTSLKKQGKVQATSPGHATPDAAVRPEASVFSMQGSQSPSAITLDIKPGEKRVRLHLNKALIRRVLESNNKLQSLDRRALSSLKPARVLQRQDTRPLLSLPLSSAIVMPEEEEDTGLQAIPEKDSNGEQDTTMLTEI